MTRCYGCFRKLDVLTGSCPYCGFSFAQHQQAKWILAPGTILNDKYIIGKTLGEGGFGITYLAWDVNMEVKVAIKEYYPSSLVSRDITTEKGNSLTVTDGANHAEGYEEGLKSYVKEAAILSKCFELSGIVTVKDFFYANDTAYIVMEYIQGVSLKKYLEQKGEKLSSDESLKLIRPIITSLAIIHKNNLLHRDISLDNIMLDDNGRVKLIDFGAARYLKSESDKSMTVVLKRGYAPVEQYSRKGEQGSWTDIYALCAVLYRMITGTIPEESTDRISKDNLIEVKKLARKTPTYVAKAIERGLSVLPEKRQQSMEELYQDLYVPQKGKALYQILRRGLLSIILCLFLVVTAGFIYYYNRDSVDHFVNRVKAVFQDNPEMQYAQETPVKDYREEELNKEEGQGAAKQIQQAEEEVQNSSETEENIENNAADQVIEPEKEPVQEPVIPEAVPQEDTIPHEIIVVRDGMLDGYGNSGTVGDILDMYSDTPGSWDTYINSSNQLFVYYLGSKNEESFTIEFLVFSNDTFKVTGAAIGGERIEEYSDFFQQILNTVGV